MPPNRATLFHVEIPMTEPFRISSGEVTSKESVVIRIERDGTAAFGEASPMAGGFYSSETPSSSLDFLIRKAIPDMVADGSFRPEFIANRVENESGERFAWAGLEGALCDLQVQEEGSSFAAFLGCDIHPIQSGLAVGIYPEIDLLLQASARYLEAGYKRLKIKIEPGWDIEPLQAIRETFGDIPLMVDANAAYADEHFPIFDRLDDLGLLMIEQPLAEANIEGHVLLQSRLETPVCLDESASNLEVVDRAIGSGACKIVNLKIQRVGGLLQAKRMNELCAQRGIPTWMGTMPELGIGAVHALYLGMSANCTYPTDVEASERWFVEDIIDPPIEVREGLIEIPEPHRRRPNVDMAAIERYAVKAEEISF